MKSIRQDEQSYDAIATGASPVPMLKLDRVILLRNEDLGALYAAANPISGTDLDNRFSYATCGAAQGDPYFMNVSKYRLFKNNLDQNALKSSVFTQDYSLCRKYAYSINTHYTAGTTYLIYEPSANLNPMVNATSVIGYKTGTYSYSDANDGKLTLTNITFLDLQSQRVTPGFDFDYAQTDATKNPDYDMNKTDLWGFYKSDWQAGYSHNVSVTSKDYTSAWSLRGVTSPLNGKMQVEYESDDYTAEGFANDANLVLNPNFATFQVPATEPSLIFPIQGASANYQVPCDECFGDFSFENPDFSGFYNQYATDNTGLFDAAELVVPSVRSCNNVPNNNGFTTYYYTVNTVAQIGKTSSPVNNVWNFSLSYPSGVDPSGNPIMSQGGVTDLDMQYTCSSAGGGYGVSNYNKYFSYAYVIFKMKKLYGGGIRVKTIKTIEPRLNNTYTESYTYDNGYCPNVPKKFTLESFSGPSYYALCMNNKTGLEGVSSNVGYSTVTVSHVSMNNASNGKTVLTFKNNPVNNPIVATFQHPQSHDNPCNQYFEPSTVCGSYAVNWDFSGGLPHNEHFRTVPDIDLQIYFAYDNKELISLGQLKSTALYADGATTPVLSTTYQYADINSYSYLGENYNYLKIEDPHHYNCNYFSCRDASNHVVSQHYASCDPKDTYTIYHSYINRDCFLASTITTRDGITISEEVLDRDPNTGTPLKTRTIDPTQGIFVNRSRQAYLNTSYSAMGLKSVNEGYKNQPNMMESTQKLRFPYSAASLYVDETTDPNASIVVSENKNTFSTSYPYRVYNTSSSQYENSTQAKNWWRLYETYTRLLDDVTSYNITSYNWRKLSEGTLYDTENNKIEEKGLNDRKAASKWGYGNRYKLAAISNANYNSFTFTGFEDKFQVASNTYHFGGEVTGGQYQYTYVAQATSPGGSSNPRPVITVVNPHTGYYLARVPAATDGPAFTTSNFEVGRTYTAKVWVHRASASSAKLAIDLVGYINPGGGASSIAVNTHKEISKTDNSNVTVGNWILMSVDIIVPDKFDLTATHHMSVYVRNSATAGDAFFDDLAFHPKDAAMAGHVYEARTGLLKAQLDNDNFATLYNYDNAGRVISTYKEYSGGIKKITENQYHFSKP